MKLSQIPPGKGKLGKVTHKEHPPNHPKYLAAGDAGGCSVSTAAFSRAACLEKSPLQNKARVRDALVRG